MFKRLLILPLLFIASAAFSQIKETAWVDSIFNNLSMEDKIAQLMMIRVDMADEKQNNEDILNDYKMGGVMIAHGTPAVQADFVSQLQQHADIPLFVAMEPTGTMTPQMDSLSAFPSPVFWTAVGSDSLSAEIGKTLGRRLHDIGVNLNFLPIDHNLVPVEGGNYSSGPADGFNVFESTVTSFCLGLKHEHILNCIRYAPTALSVTKIRAGVPSVTNKTDSLQSRLIKKLVKNGITGIAPTATELPLIFSRRSRAAKNKYSSDFLSSIFTGSNLKKEFNFDNGLVFASIPQARLDKNGSASAEVTAFTAGNDILLGPDVPSGIRTIKRAIKKDPRLEAKLDAAVKKILHVKYAAGLVGASAPHTDNLVERLNDNPQTRILQQTIIDQAVTVVKNDDALLPIKSLDIRKLACVSTGDPDNAFAQYLSTYGQVDRYAMPVVNDSVLTGKLKMYDVIFVALFSDSLDVRNITEQLLHDLHGTHVVFCDFTLSSAPSLYALSQAAVLAYTAGPLAERSVPAVIFGALPAKGHLPYDISTEFTAGRGLNTDPLSRLAYGIPESVGMSSKTLKRIEEIAQEAIDSGATPGCYVVVARKGKIIYDQGFGFQTYDKKIPVDGQTLYDLASLTKVSSTLQAFMFLYEKGFFDLDKKASVYLPELKGTNKEDLTLRDILTHQSGLLPFLPFWKQTMKDTALLPEFYSHTFSDKYSQTVAKGLYTLRNMPDTLWNWVIKSPMRPKTGRQPYNYVYSDMSFYIIYHLCERYLNQPVSDFVTQNLYEPLGASSMGFLPLSRFPEWRIAPTERDTLWRKELLIGTVHDQGAALSGGIAGHAGLFGSAYDMMKLGQMLLQKGYYGGLRYYKPETVDFFTAQQFAQSQRGLGWNKPVQSSWISATSVYASPETFGHTGFTGTCLWIDPEFDLVYVFLSNRVNPVMTNNKLIHLNIRSRIQDTIYQSIFEYCRDPLIY